MKKIPDGCIEVPLEEVDYIYQPPQSHTPVIVMKQKLPPMQSRVLECMKCGSKKNLNTNKDKSFVECDECMWGIEKDGTRLADEFYSLAPRYRTKVKLQEMIDKWLDKAREEVLIELQKEFSEFGVPDDVRYTQPLFYINEVIEKKLSKLITK